MKLKPIQKRILFIQIAVVTLNLYAIFIKRTEDYKTHMIGISLVLLMMILSIKSWIDASKQPGAK